jgi:hypothetical protein
VFYEDSLADRGGAEYHDQGRPAQGRPA